MTSEDKKALVVLAGSMFVALTYGAHVVLKVRKLKKHPEAYRSACDDLIDELNETKARLKAKSDEYDRRMAETEFKSPIPD